MAPTYILRIAVVKICAARGTTKVKTTLVSHFGKPVLLTVGVSRATRNNTVLRSSHEERLEGRANTPVHALSHADPFIIFTPCSSHAYPSGPGPAPAASLTCKHTSPRARDKTKNEVPPPTPTSGYSSVAPRVRQYRSSATLTGSPRQPQNSRELGRR